MSPPEDIMQVIPLSPRNSNRVEVPVEGFATSSTTVPSAEINLTTPISP